MSILDPIDFDVIWAGLVGQYVDIFLIKHF